MQNKRFNRNIFGDLPTQKMAQKALPILVAYAQKCKTITLAELAKVIELNTQQFNWTMLWIFKWIQTTLYELEREDNWEYGEIPRYYSHCHRCARNADKLRWIRRTRVDPNTPISWKDYETNHVLSVFKYSYWEQVMDFVIGKLN